MPLNYFNQRMRFHIASFWLIGLTMLNIVLAVRSAGESDRVDERVTAAITKSDQRWCHLFDNLLDVSDKNPPSSQYGKDQVKLFADLYRQFSCPAR